jgi:hypothetical protein
MASLEVGFLGPAQLAEANTPPVLRNRLCDLFASSGASWYFVRKNFVDVALCSAPPKGGRSTLRVGVRGSLEPFFLGVSFN